MNAPRNVVIGQQLHAEEFATTPYHRGPLDLVHKHGGRITHIIAIGHHAFPPKDGHSQDRWFFIGDVNWHDGTQSIGIEIAPFEIVQHCDAALAQLDEISRAMNLYLREQGEWCGIMSGRTGWYARRRASTATEAELVRALEAEQALERR